MALYLQQTLLYPYQEGFIQIGLYQKYCTKHIYRIILLSKNVNILYHGSTPSILHWYLASFNL